MALESGEELRAPVVVSTIHPKIAFLQLLDRDVLPPDFVRDMEVWKTRSGVVKVNLAISELPDFVADPGKQVQDHHTASVELCFSPEGVHNFSMFTQWVPHEWSNEPHREELEAYADRIVDLYDELAPNFKKSIIARQMIRPCEMEQELGLIGGNIFHDELSVEQLFHMRPAPGDADFRTPIKGLYNGSSATHGGGDVCGIPGWPAFRAAMKDTTVPEERPGQRPRRRRFARRGS